MPKRYEISEEQVAGLEALRKRNKNKNVEKRIKALLLHGAGEKREKVAEQTGFVKTYISELVSRYCNQEISAITGENYRGNHRNLSYVEEEILLESFKKAAAEGQIVEISEIKRTYEKAIGHSLDNTHGQIYYVLHRQARRKILP